MSSDRARNQPRPDRMRRHVRVGAALAAGAGILGAAAPAAAAPAAAAPAAAAPVAPTSLLQPGSKGASVERVQRALHVPTIGRFDNATRRAVVRFQRRHHLLPDGIVGVQTWDALFHIAPPPAAPVASANATSSTAQTSSGYSIPSGIVQCESGGNYLAVNASSGAGGAYQILPSTWQAYGGQGLPENAPKAEQDQIAAKIYATQGPSAWTC